MLLTTLIIGLGAAAHLAVAHTVMTTLYVDGVSQGDGTCVRMNNLVANEATYPVNDTTSNDMACGIDGETGVSRVCAANKSSILTFQFKMYPDGSSQGVIADSHLGSCAVYLKQVDSAVADPGYGDGWFKIWESGYDEANEEWCTTKLINNGGYLSIQLPEDLAGGYYLARTELLALHNAYDLNNPQFYLGCSQLFLSSDETAVPTDTVAIPGYVTMGEPALHYNIYADPLDLPYPQAGPAVYEGVDAPSNVVRKREVAVQTEGLKPEACILTSANWCGMALDSYSDNAGCWNGSAVCWNEFRDCVNSTGAIGSNEYCDLFENYCTSINDACTAKNYNGPPDASNLQPEPATIAVDLVTSSASATASSSAVDTSTTDVAETSTTTRTTRTTSSKSLSSRAPAPAVTVITTRITTTSIVTVIETKSITVTPTTTTAPTTRPVVIVTDIVYDTVIEYINANGQFSLTTLPPGALVPAVSPVSSVKIGSSSAVTTGGGVKASSDSASAVGASSQSGGGIVGASTLRASSTAVSPSVASNVSSASPSSSGTGSPICARDDGPSEKEMRAKMRREVVREVRAAFARGEEIERMIQVSE